MGRLKKNVEKAEQTTVNAPFQKRPVKEDKEQDKSLHLVEVSEQELLYWRVDVYPYLM